MNHKQIKENGAFHFQQTEVRPNPSFGKYDWLIHVGVWMVLASFPLLAGITSHTSELPGWDFYGRFLIMLTSIVIMFYVNFLFLVNRFLFTKRTLWFAFINILLIFGIISVVHFCMELLPDTAGPPGRPDRPEHHDRPPKEVMRLGFYLWNSMIYIFVIALSVAFRSTLSWFRVEAERKELERIRTEAEMQNLKSQLNPHFLFNTLNNIYSLIAISQDKAQDAVHELSRLLRYVMHESSRPQVSLEKELDFIRNYVELMRIRQPGHVTVETAFSTVTPQTQIAPLLFISLIENAFKHGVSNNKPSFIRIDIHQKGKTVICAIENSYFPKDLEHDKSGSGIGLTNLHKRLDLLYPGRHKVQYEQDENLYRVTLSILLNTKES